MHRESIFVCTYVSASEEHVAHVRAWDAREAAETFAREIELELELEPGSVRIPVDETHVRLVIGGDGAGSAIAA